MYWLKKIKKKENVNDFKEYGKFLLNVKVGIKMLNNGGSVNL